MKKLLWILLVGALVVSGCGKDKDDPKETAELIAPEQASDYLLTLREMPSGWSQEATEEEEPDDSPNVICIQRDDTPDAEGRATVDFRAGTFGPYLSQIVGVFGSVDEAKTEFAAYSQAVDQCATWTETDTDGKTLTYTINKMSFDKVGDESLALRMDMNGQGAAEVIYIRKSNMVVTVAYITLVIAGPQESIFAEIVGKAAKKFE